MDSNDKGKIGEEFVNELSYSSFFRYWCFPSPKDEAGDKKEICDLLIVFGHDIIIFSVKNYTFNENYSRYFRKTIDKAARQIYGAESKLFKNDCLYIKHPDRPVERFEKNKIRNIYRVIINLGEGLKFYPFNCKTKGAKFISVFDKYAFAKLVKELDTLPDFIEYLEKRERFFFDKDVIILPGEENDFPLETAEQFFTVVEGMSFETKGRKKIILSGTELDLLANYIQNARSFPEVLKSEDFTHAHITLDGTWDEFISNAQVISKKYEDKISYFIDELVKREVLINSDHQSVNIAKELLSLNRFERRFISKSFFEFYEKHQYNTGNKFARQYGDFNETGIVFVFYTLDMPQPIADNLIELAMYSFMIFSNYSSKKIISICTTTDLQQIKVAFFENQFPFPKDVELEIKEAAAKLGWFTNHQEIRFNEREYPK